MGKEANRTKQRDEILKKVIDFLQKEYDTDILTVGSGEIAMPAVDDQQEEFYFKFSASIPRGKRILGEDGTNHYEPYNAYDEQDEWNATLKEREDKAKAREDAAKRKAADKLRKANAKKVIKKLNTDGLDKMIHSTEDE